MKFYELFIPLANLINFLCSQLLPFWIMSVLVQLIVCFTFFHYIKVCVCVLVIQSCLNLCDPMDCNAPGSSVLEYVKAVYFTLLFTYMQSTSWETLGWMKHKLESRLSGEISITSDMQMTSTLGRKPRTKEPPNESERGEWKSWLKTQHSEN